MYGRLTLTAEVSTSSMMAAASTAMATSQRPASAVSSCPMPDRSYQPVARRPRAVDDDARHRSGPHPYRPPRRRGADSRVSLGRRRWHGPRGGRRLTDVVPPAARQLVPTGIAIEIRAGLKGRCGRGGWPAPRRHAAQCAGHDRRRLPWRGEGLARQPRGGGVHRDGGDARRPARRGARQRESSGNRWTR